MGGEETVVCVMGMSRSGTSLTTRILNLCGLYLGPEEELLGRLPSNLDGHWENRPILRFNEWLLRSLGGNWKTPPEMPPGWELAAGLMAERHAARGFLERTFAGHPLWGWKDPRNCLTLPFWQHLVSEMRYVICLRNPIDVAASLERREGGEVGAAFELWLAYANAALANTEGRPRIVIAYEDYFDDWRAAVARLLRFAFGESPPAGADVLDRIRDTVKADLRHHATPVEAVLTDPRVPSDVASLYLRLSAERFAVVGGVGAP